MLHRRETQDALARRKADLNESMHTVQQASFRLQAALGMRNEPLPYAPPPPISRSLASPQYAEATVPAGVVPKQMPNARKRRLLPSETFSSTWNSRVNPAFGTMFIPDPVDGMWRTPGLAGSLCSWHQHLMSQQIPSARSAPLQCVAGFTTSTCPPEVLFDVSLPEVTSISLHDVTIPAHVSHDIRYATGRWLFILIGLQASAATAPRPSSCIPAHTAPVNGSSDGQAPRSAASGASVPQRRASSNSQPERGAKRQKVSGEMGPPPLRSLKQGRPNLRTQLIHAQLTQAERDTPWLLLAFPFSTITARSSYPVPASCVPASLKFANGGQGKDGPYSRKLMQTQLEFGLAGDLPLVEGQESRVGSLGRFCEAVGCGKGLLVLWSEEGVDLGLE